MASVTLKNIKKRYDSVEVLHGIDLEIQDREFIMFVGPSGCGKSTLLRMIAGLEPITEGDILIGAERVNDLSPAQRDIAMVFQDYALYPHMTVRQNMSFSLELRKTPQTEIYARVERAAQMLRIESYEPLSNLDAKLRIDVRAEIKDLARRLQTTMIFVTHDQVEAMTMADRIVVLNAGKLQQVGAPEELYERPANLFVATFIGAPTMNLFTVSLQQLDGQWFACTPEGMQFIVAPSHLSLLLASGGMQFTMGLRPEHIGETSSVHSVQHNAKLVMVEPLGSDTYVYFDSGSKRCVGRISPERKPKLGDTLPLAFDMSRAHWFDTEGNAVEMA